MRAATLQGFAWAAAAAAGSGGDWCIHDTSVHEKRAPSYAADGRENMVYDILLPVDANFI